MSFVPRPETVGMRLLFRKLVVLNGGIVLLFIFDRVGKWLALHVLPREGVFARVLKGGMIHRGDGIVFL